MAAAMALDGRGEQLITGKPSQIPYGSSSETEEGSWLVLESYLKYSLRTGTWIHIIRYYTDVFE